MKRTSPPPQSSDSLSASTPAPKFFSSIRPEPSSLFSRASITTTVAVVNAIMLAGSAEAQSVAKPSPSPAARNARNTTTTTLATTTAPAATTAAVEDAQLLPEIVVQANTDSYKPEKLESPKYTAPILDTPQTINVIPQAVMQEQGATTLREVLRNVPGISIQAGEGGVPAGDNLSIRGFNARTDMFVDGIRDVGGYTRDPFNFEQVEVSKGPSSAYAGRGSTGGSINLVTKTPKIDPFYSGELGIGTDQFQRYSLDVNQPIENSHIPGTALRLNAMWTHNGVPGRDFVENERWGIAPSLAFGLGTDTRVVLSYFHLQQENVPDYGIPWVPNNTAAAPLTGELAKYANQPPPVSFSNWYGLKKHDFDKTTTDVGTFEFEHDFNESFTLRNAFRYGQTRRDSVYSTPRFVTPTLNTDIKRELKPRDQVDSIVADQIDLKFKFETFGREHTLNVGADYAHEYEKNKIRVSQDPSGMSGPNADLYNPDAQDKPYPFTENGAFNETTSNAVGIYAFDTIKLHEQLELSGGVRWDYYEVDYESKPADNATTSTLYFNRVDKFLSWRLGPVYKPLPNGSIYMAYGTSFNPSSEGFTLTAATAELEPETNATFEIGTKWEFFDGRLLLNGAIFRTNKENARTPGLTPDDPPTVLEGEQRVDGLELGVAGSITDHWKVYSGFSYLNSQIVSSNNPAEVGKRLPNTPQTSFNFWTTYELPWNITIGGGAQYVGSRFNDTANLRKAPDYWTCDAMVSYQITQNLTARLNIYNLADEEYIGQLGGGHFIPGPGRSGTLTLSFKF